VSAPEKIKEVGQTGRQTTAGGCAASEGALFFRWAGVGECKKFFVENWGVWIVLLAGCRGCCIVI